MLVEKSTIVSGSCTSSSLRWGACSSGSSRGAQQKAKKWGNLEGSVSRCLRCLRCPGPPAKSSGAVARRRWSACCSARAPPGPTSAARALRAARRGSFARVPVRISKPEDADGKPAAHHPAARGEAGGKDGSNHAWAQRILAKGIQSRRR